MKGDMVIISASPIPGNEKAISNTINMLIKQGADVFYESIAGVHVSGHAAQEEIKMMIGLVKPKYFIPIHGENKHKIQNAKLAEMVGIKKENIIIAQNGDVVKINSKLCRVSSNLKPKTIYVDGVGFGNIEDIVIRDRKLLSRDGIIMVVVGIGAQKGNIIYEPNFILKGVIYIENFDSVLEESKRLVIDSIKKCFNSNITNCDIIEKYIIDILEKFIFKKIRIKPIIIARIISF